MHEIYIDHWDLHVVFHSFPWFDLVGREPYIIVDMEFNYRVTS